MRRETFEGRPGFHLSRRLRASSKSVCVQSLRSNASSVLELAGGPIDGLPGLLAWLIARSEQGLSGDRADEAEELMELEALAWEKASAKTSQQRLSRVLEGKVKAEKESALEQQAALRTHAVEREEERRRGPDLSHIPKPNKATTLKKCPLKVGQQIDCVLDAIRHDEDDLDELIPLGLEALLEEIWIEPESPLSEVDAAPPEAEPKVEAADTREQLEQQLQLPYRPEDRPGLGLAVSAIPAPMETTMPVAFLDERSGWDKVAEALPEEAARAGLISRLRNVLLQAPADSGIIQLSVADGQALARLLLS